jgi:DNA-binding CsgD family transcriptional regulator
MDKRENFYRFAGIGLVAAGGILLGLYFFLKQTVNIALPLVFLMLGAAFYVLVFAFLHRWRWAAWFFMPGSLLLAFGIIFLLNVITGDFKAWAYAWLLLIAGAGLGFAQTARYLAFGEKYVMIGMGTLLGGIALSAVFGVIADGKFIQLMAPILLAAGGLALFWLKPAGLFKEHAQDRAEAQQNGPLPSSTGSPALVDALNAALVEPLSVREIEVLRLIDQGHTNAEIADRLTVAHSTVKTHINNIYGKLGVTTRVQALNRARELGLLK